MSCSNSTRIGTIFTQRKEREQPTSVRSIGALAISPRPQSSLKREEDADGNTELSYKLVSVASSEDHTCIPDPSLVIADRIKENMKREVIKDPWTPVIQIYNKITNEQVYNVYPQDVIAAVDRRMAVRGEGFLNVVQSKLTAETNF